MELLKIGYIIDKNNFNYKETVVYNEKLEIQFYPFNKETEELIKTNLNPFEFIKPKWNGDKWIESASEEEIKEHNDFIEKEREEFEKNKVNNVSMKEEMNMLGKQIALIKLQLMKNSNGGV